MSELTNDKEYRDWIVSIKSRVQASQIKAAVAVNYAMLELYWYLGEQIIERQETAEWGDGFLQQMSKDLFSEFPEIRGFSYRNLRSIRQWVSFWNQPDSIGKQAVSKSDPNWKQVVAKLAPDAKQLVSQIPWGHNILLLQKLDHPADALFYVQKTIENNWSRAVLTHQIESGLHRRFTTETRSSRRGQWEDMTQIRRKNWEPRASIVKLSDRLPHITQEAWRC